MNQKYGVSYLVAVKHWHLEIKENEVIGVLVSDLVVLLLFKNLLKGKLTIQRSVHFHKWVNFFEQLLNHEEVIGGIVHA